MWRGTWLGVAALALLAILAAGSAAAGREDEVIVIRGRRAPEEASVSTKALKYLPFEVPEGVTGIRIHKELDFGPGGATGTVDHGLFDPRGVAFGGRGFRAWQGGERDDLVLTGNPDEDRWSIPGPIPAGTWLLAQSFLRSSPEGLRYTYTITLSFGGPKPPATAPVPAYEPGVLDPKPGWYAGSLHNHTLHSDGRKTLDEVAAIAEAAGYHFLAGTDHNTTRQHWGFARAAKRHPGLLLLFGEEVTTPSGHASVLGMRPGAWLDFRMDAGDGRLPGVIREAHRQGALFSINHPFSMCMTCPWKFPESEYHTADTVEVWNGAWGPDDRLAVDWWDAMLKAGKRIPAVGGADYHRDPDPMTPATVVHAGSLSRDAVLSAMKGGHAFLSESPAGPHLYLSGADGSGYPGDAVDMAADGTLPVAVRVSGGKGLSLRLVWATGERTLPVEGEDVTKRFAAPAGARYVRAELLRPDGAVAALTNPVYAGHAD